MALYYFVVSHLKVYTAQLSNTSKSKAVEEKTHLGPESSFTASCYQNLKSAIYPSGARVNSDCDFFSLSEKTDMYSL